MVYFPVPPLVKRYWIRSDIKELRNNILFPRDMGTRDSADEKVKSFLHDAQNMIATLRHLESLDEIYAVQSVFFAFIVAIVHNINAWSRLTFMCTVVLNILLIISIKITKDEGQYYNVEGNTYRTVINRLGIVHLILTFLTFFSYLVLTGWMHVKTGLKENPLNELTFHGYLTSRFIRFLNHCHLLGTHPVNRIGNIITVHPWSSTLAVKYLLEQPETLYYFALLSFSFAGNFQSPLFFSLCLAQILRRSKLMQYVTRAFTANIDQVLATILLGVIFMYLFTVLALSDRRIHNQYYFDEIGVDGCYSLQSCFRMHLDYGLLAGVFWKNSNEIGSVQGELFNFGFTFIMQVVIPGLISGIIIDTFSEMRGNKKAIEEDVVNTCFICNIDREDFETSNVSFEEHVRNDHSMWKYIWFMIHLDEKDKTEFDGIENFCYEIIRKKESTRWLPMKMARALSQLRDKFDLFTIYMKITSLQNSLEKIQSELKTDASNQTKEVREGMRGDLQNLEKAMLRQMKRLEKNLGSSRAGGSAETAGKEGRGGEGGPTLDAVDPSAPAQTPLNTPFPMR